MVVLGYLAADMGGIPSSEQEGEEQSLPSPVPKREEPERPQPKREEPEHPQPKREEPERPTPEWEEPERPQPKRGESVHPQPKREESQRNNACCPHVHQQRKNACCPCVHQQCECLLVSLPPPPPQSPARKAEPHQSPAREAEQHQSPAKGDYTLLPPPSPGDCTLLPPSSPGDHTLLPPPLLPPQEPEGEELQAPPPENFWGGEGQDAGVPQQPLFMLLKAARRAPAQPPQRREPAPPGAEELELPLPPSFFAAGRDQQAVSRATTGRGADSMANHGPTEASLPSPRLCPGLLGF
ncbi:UNVERIFIED_CONTAM: hypothetical protein FKN15_074795 [Acipenser sinensis]